MFLTKKYCGRRRRFYWSVEHSWMSHERSFPTQLQPPVDLVPGDFVPDESLDGALAAKEKLLKEKQQVWNRGQFRATGFRPQADSCRYSSEPGTRILTYRILARRRIRVLHQIGPMFYAPWRRLYVLRIRRLLISRFQLL